MLEQGGCVQSGILSRCPFYYEVDPIMQDRATSRPLVLSDKLSIASGDGAEESAHEEESLYDPYSDSSVSSNKNKKKKHK